MNNEGNDIKRTQVVPIYKFDEGLWQAQDDALSIEEPLEMRLEFGPLQARQKKNVAITMRTPGDDEALAIGFLFSEGIINNTAQLLAPAQRSGKDGNVLSLLVRPEVPIDIDKLKRNFYTTSSCGVCGKESIEALQSECPAYLYYETPPIEPDIILSLPATLRQHQKDFKTTGGIHAAALFSSSGVLELLCEDVGRHNALDKLIGHQILQAQGAHLALGQKILLLSGRASFELIQKAAMAGIRVVCAVGAPSSLAVATAKNFDITLIGFLKSTRFNIYSGPLTVGI